MKISIHLQLLCISLVSLLSVPCSAETKELVSLPKRPSESVPLDELGARGRYLVTLGGCNDCHTAGFASSNGGLPEKLWLLGDPTGWFGPWGTTYAINLRLFVKDMSVEQWIHVARTVQGRPPMPWYVLRDMEEKDLRAIYRYLQILGPAGEAMPEPLAPGENPKTPYINFALVTPQALQKE